MPKPSNYTVQTIKNCASCAHFINRNIIGEPGVQCDKHTWVNINLPRDKPVDFEPDFNGKCDDYKKN